MFRHFCICVVQVFSSWCGVTQEAFGKLTSCVGYGTLSKKSISSSLIIKKILPKIVFVVFQTLLHMHCANFRQQIEHLVMQFGPQGGLWQSDQPRELMHPLNRINFSFITFKKNLTQNRRCLSTGMFSACSIKLKAGAAIWFSCIAVPAATIDVRVNIFSNFIFI